MKNVLTLLFTSLFFFFSQAQTIIKTFNTPSSSIAAATCNKPLSGGGFAVGGIVGDSSSWEDFAMILDSSYNVVWSKKYESGKPYDEIIKIDTASDGGFLLIGNYTANLSDPLGFSIIKADSKGNFLWEKIYPGFQLYSCTKTSDKGYILGGITSGTSNYTVIGVTKIDSAFNLQWSYSYGGTNGEAATSIKETFDHGFIITGGTWSFGVDADAIFVLKIDSSGMPLWSKSYDGPDLDYGDDIILDKDSGFTLGGFGSAVIDTLGNIVDDELLLKIDNGGNVLWGKLYEFGDLNHIEIGADNGYYLYSGFSITKADSSGNFEWTKSYYTYPFPYGEYYSYNQADADNYTLFGSIYQGASTFIMKTTSQQDSCTLQLNNILTYPYTPVVNNITFTLTPQYGQDTVVSVSSDLAFTDSVLCSSDFNTSVQDKPVNTNEGINLYPNPVKDQLTIHSLFNVLSIDIYNVLGVRQNCDQISASKSKEETVVDVNSLAAGVYFVEVSNKAQRAVLKFVKQ